MHGGTVSVESTEGVGTTFAVDLPSQTPPEAPAVAEAAATEVAHMSDAASEQPVILAADDDQDILELVAFRLERSGYTVIQARDGEEALRLALERKPDLAVLDVMMPKLDGFELTRRLRAEEATRRMPIILLTARAQDADVQAGLRRRRRRLPPQALQPAGAPLPGAGDPRAPMTETLLVVGARPARGDRRSCSSCSPCGASPWRARDRRRAEAERLVRPLAIALVEEDDAETPSLSAGDQAVLAEVLGRYARKLSGEAHARIGAYFRTSAGAARRARRRSARGAHGGVPKPRSGSATCAAPRPRRSFSRRSTTPSGTSARPPRAASAGSVSWMPRCRSSSSSSRGRLPHGVAGGRSSSSARPSCPSCGRSPGIPSPP